MDEKCIRLEGKLAGETSLILVGVHGNESCGVEAVEKILPNLTVERGTVFIAYGNPRAIERNVRFTEANLNRMFKPDAQLTEAEQGSYEYERARYLKTLMQQAEKLLDVHASFVPDSKPFIICEKNAYQLASQLPFETVVSGFDHVEPGGTDYYMNAIGKEGISVECGYLADPASTERAGDVIMKFLQVRGHVREGLAQYDSVLQSYFRMHTLYLTKTDNFTLARPFADFDIIHKGELIGTDGTEAIVAEAESIILFARNPGQAGDEAFLQGEKKTAEHN